MDVRKHGFETDRRCIEESADSLMFIVFHLMFLNQRTKSMAVTVRWYHIQPLSVTGIDFHGHIFQTAVRFHHQVIQQKHITDFLDRKCAEIDELIILQETMIAELKRYKRSVITETVTKGLCPNVPMKDSGVKCVGEIPCHWDMVSVPFVFHNLNYLRGPISSEKRERNNPQYDYYGASGIIDKIDNYNVDDKVLLIAVVGTNLKLRNLPLIYKAEGRFWVSHQAHILKPKKDDYDYMYYMLEALDYSDYITGSAEPVLSQERLSKVKVCVPPLAEQKSIANYLNKKCSEIDELIVVKQQKIEALKEYRKSVIFEYVIGRRKVSRT